MIKSILRRQIIPVILLGGSVAFGVLPTILATLNESRTWRDIIMVTPFHSVEVLDQELTDKGLIVSGEMIKRRCIYQKNSESAYIRLSHGKSIWVHINTKLDPNSGRGNRPPSKNVQDWGPWLIEKNLLGNPISFEIWVKHLCPGENEPQDNLFIGGEWATIHVEK